VSKIQIAILGLPNHLIVVSSINAISYGDDEITIHFKEGGSIVISLDEDEFYEALETINDIFK
jgi:hypothetical protein